MIDDLPAYISLVFGATVLMTCVIFLRAAHGSRRVLFGMLLWVLVQGALGLSLFYTVTEPPRVLLTAALPANVLIIGLFVSERGRQFIDGLDLESLTWLHAVRVPVEIVLLWLFLAGTFPQIGTFEGRNFDILAGLTAPIVAYWGIRKGKFGRNAIILWNVICLALLINIVTIGALSIPSFLQRLAFDQPNIALLHFPFAWLISVIVPLVFFSHLVAIRQLLIGNPSQR